MPPRPPLEPRVVPGLPLATFAEFQANFPKPYPAGAAWAASIGNLDGLSMQQWGNDYASTGFMHVSDHESAWATVHPDTPPTWGDIVTSQNVGGDALPTAALRIHFRRDGPDAAMLANATALRMYLLNVLHGMANGPRIFSGTRPDPNHGAALSAVKEAGEWRVAIGAVAPPIEPPPPPPPPPPVEEPPVPTAPAKPELPGGIVDDMKMLTNIRQGRILRWTWVEKQALDRVDTYVRSIHA